MGMDAVGGSSAAAGLASLTSNSASKGGGSSASGGSSSPSTTVVSTTSITNSDGSITTVTTYADGHAETTTTQPGQALTPAQGAKGQGKASSGNTGNTVASQLPGTPTGQKNPAGANAGAGTVNTAEGSVNLLI